MMKLPMKMLVVVPSLPHSSNSSSASGVPATAMPSASASSRTPVNITRTVDRLEKSPADRDARRATCRVGRTSRARTADDQVATIVGGAEIAGTGDVAVARAGAVDHARPVAHDVAVAAAGAP